MKGAILGLGIAAYFVTSLLWLEGARPPKQSTFPRGSVYNNEPQGVSLAYRYLATRGAGGPAKVLSRPLDQREVEPNAVVFRFRPGVVPFFDLEDEDHEKERKDEETKDGKEKDKKPGDAPNKPAKSRKQRVTLLDRIEEAWVRGGGRLVLAVDESFGPAGVVTQSDPRREVAAQKVFPLWPQVERVYPEPRRFLSGDFVADAHAILVLEDRPILMRQKLGQGEVFVLAIPELLENARLASGDHLALLESLASADRPVYFDEASHGLGTAPGLLEVLLDLRFGPALVVLGILGASQFWRGKRRIGPAVDDYAEVRSDAVELLDSLAQFYDRSLRRDETAHLYYEAFVRSVAARTGLRGDALAARVASLVGPAPREPRRTEADLPHGALLRAIRTINDGFRRLQA